VIPAIRRGQAPPVLRGHGEPEIDWNYRAPRTAPAGLASDPMQTALV
jgi:hypothetical protein